MTHLSKTSTIPTAQAKRLRFPNGSTQEQRVELSRRDAILKLERVEELLSEAMQLLLDCEATAYDDDLYAAYKRAHADVWSGERSLRPVLTDVRRRVTDSAPQDRSIHG